jgi:predicted regulator of Ras-like GTPase activity (Roadblock/LC7/MglB family)
MDTEELEQRLAELMSTLSECEGLIVADKDGQVLVGQTLVERDLDSIAKAAASLINNSANLGGAVDKGSMKNAVFEYGGGFAILVNSDDKIFIALLGVDGRSSSTLLKRRLNSIANS